MINGDHRVYNAVGYRGINEDCYLKFMKSEYLSYSRRNDEYFGHGIYFFEEDAREAFNFAKNVRTIDDVYIIEAVIEVERKFIFDLIDSTTHYKFSKLFYEKVLGRYDNHKKKPEVNDCGLINIICDKEGYKLVRGAFSPDSIYSDLLIANDYSRIKKTHVQLCVKDKEIIINSKLFNHNFK